MLSLRSFRKIYERMTPLDSLPVSIGIMFITIIVISSFLLFPSTSLVADSHLAGTGDVM